jgi:hypothetical protein
MKKKLCIVAVFVLTFFSSFVGFSIAGQLVYSTFIGGSNNDYPSEMALDSARNVYITGNTYSSDFPTTPAAFDTSFNGVSDVFVTKLNYTGSALNYSTYLGGGDSEWDNYIAIDSSGNAYITGRTLSIDFPTTVGAFDTTLNNWDFFVTKLNPSGSALVYSSFLGGSAIEIAGEIAVDGSGNAYVTGGTGSSDFPTTVDAFDTTWNNGDAFVTKFNDSGSALLYSTFLGGSGGENGLELTLDSSGNIYIAGLTQSPDFPTTPGAFDTTNNNASTDIFITKLNAAGSALLYSTYLGGNNLEVIRGSAVDSSGNIYLTGYTDSSDFPTTAGAFDTTYNGGIFTIYDGFVSKLNASGSVLVYSTYLGGSSDDYGYGIALDNAGNAYITGLTYSSNFPVTLNAFDTTHNGGMDGFISKLNANGSGLLYSTFLGGSADDAGWDIVVDKAGIAYISGYTQSSEFPTTSGAYDTTFNVSTSLIADVFVTKLVPGNIPLMEYVAYSDINKNSSVDQGDRLTIQFDKRMRVNGATASDFYLAVTTDSLGTGASVSINTVNDTQVIITLGISPSLTIPGLFSGSTTAGASSGLDISATMTPNAIEDLEGIDAQDGGILGVNDSGVDMLYTLLGTSTAVAALSAATIQVSQDTVNAYYRKHQVVIPANSLLTTATISIDQPGENHGQLSAVSFSPKAVTFSSNTPSTLVLEYKDADIRQELGYLEYGMRIHQLQGSQWILVPQTYSKQSVDLANNRVWVKIDKFDMVGVNTTVVYANIALPSVGATSTVVAPAPSGLLKSFSPGTTLTLSVTTAGIYTNHKLTLTDYTTAYSGVTVILLQAELRELEDWWGYAGDTNYAVLKIETQGSITTNAILTLEYKDHDDENNQFKNDVLGGEERKMRIYHWLGSGVWEKVAGQQVVNPDANTVTVSIGPVSGTQMYAVKVDPITAVDYPWEMY